MKPSLKICQSIGRNPWLPLKLRRSIVKRIYPHKKSPDYTFSTDFYETIYTGNLRNWIDWNVFFFGAYELGLLNLFKKIMENGLSSKGIFVDVGANVGQHSIFLSRYARRVYSFEPYHKVRRKLEEKIARNDIKNITVYPFGLGETNERIPFFEPGMSNLGTGSFVSGRHNQGGSTTELEIAIGDEIILKENPERVDLIKIDVEGYEKAVIKGFSNTIQKYKPVVVFEYSLDTKQSFHDFPSMKRLFPDGYRFLKISGKSKEKCTLKEFQCTHGGDVIAFTDQHTICMLT